MNIEEAERELDKLCAPYKVKWAQHFIQIKDLEEKIPLPRMVGVRTRYNDELLSHSRKISLSNDGTIIGNGNDPLMLAINDYLREAEWSYILTLHIGAISLCASAVECSLKVLLPTDLKYEGKPYTGKPPSELTLGKLIPLAMENGGILAGVGLANAKKLNKLLRVPYVHSKTEEILKEKEVKTILRTARPAEIGDISKIAEVDAFKALEYTRIILKDLIELWKKQKLRK